MHDRPLRTGRRRSTPTSPALSAGSSSRPASARRFRSAASIPTPSVIYLPRGVCPVGEVDERDWGDPVQFPKAPAPARLSGPAVRRDDRLPQGRPVGRRLRLYRVRQDRLGFAAAHAVGRKTLVITTKDDIYKQWIDGAKTFLGLPDHLIGEIRADKCEVVGTAFCVAMIHSLSKDGKYPDWIAKGFGLVIFDEVHRLPAEQFSAVADMFPARLRLGLSATPERADGKELLVLTHIGPIRAKTEAQLMVPKVLRFASDWKCPRTLKLDKKTGEREVIRIPHQPGKTTHIEKMLAADQVRNRMIAELVAQALDKGRHDRRVLDPARSPEVDPPGLRDRLRHLGPQDGLLHRRDHEGREERRARREKVKPVMFTTFSMMSEGTSLDWIDTCILAMPRSNVIQPVGRIRREHPDKAPPVVMDIVDQDSPVFNAYAAGRLKWYRSIGCEIKDMT